MQKAKLLCLALWLIGAWWVLTPCLAETAAKGTISGRVLSGSGEPLRRATVEIEVVRYADGSTEPVGDTSTDDNGEFSFSNLVPARYRLQAEKSGYVAGHFPRTKALVRLLADGGIDDIVLRLVPVSAISGNVLDGNGDPLAKAVIRLLRYQFFPGGRRLTVAREAISDEHGEYRIGDLNPGRYYVVASYRSRISDVICPPVYYPDVASFDDAMAIRLGPSDEAPIKFVLLPGKPVHVRGMVTGRAAGTVRVSLIPRGGVPYAQPLTVEASDGTFQFKSVLPGDYTVLAISENSDEMLEGRTSITIRDHELNSVAVRLGMRLPHKRLRVSVDVGHYRPMQDVVISLHRAIASNDDSILAAEDELATGGRVLSTRSGNPIELPDAGPYVVSAENLPSGDYYIVDAEFNTEWYLGQMPNTENLVVHLNPYGGSVEGVVLDSTDHPLPGAVVVAIPQHVSNSRIDQSRATTADQYGQFVLHGLANTAYDIYAWDDVPEGAYYDPEFLADFAGSATEVSIESGKRYQVKLHAAFTSEE